MEDVYITIKNKNFMNVFFTFCDYKGLKFISLL